MEGAKEGRNGAGEPEWKGRGRASGGAATAGNFVSEFTVCVSK